MSKVNPRAKHSYGVITFNTSDAYRNERSLPNVVNWLKRNFSTIKEEKIIPQIKQLRKEKDNYTKEDQLRAFGVANLVELLVKDFKRAISLLRPKDDGNGMLNSVQRERLDNLNDKEKSGGGISPFTVVQVIYGIANGLYDSFEKGNLKSHEGKKVFNPADITNSEILALAKERNTAFDKRQAEKAKSEKENDSALIVEGAEEKGEITVDAILAGKVELKEVENIELLTEARKELSGGKKAAVTRRINALA